MSITKREERYLACSRCAMNIRLYLLPTEPRPEHRCQVIYKSAPFDVDLPENKAPKPPKAPKEKWLDEKPERPKRRPRRRR